MWMLIGLTGLQCLLLAMGQVFLKLALANVGSFSMSFSFFGRLLSCWCFHLHLLLFGGGSLLWWYILQKYPLSMAYPLVSFSYIFGMLASSLFLHETITPVRWAGAVLIIAGCLLIAK